MSNAKAEKKFNQIKNAMEYGREFGRAVIKVKGEKFVVIRTGFAKGVEKDPYELVKCDNTGGTIVYEAKNLYEIAEFVAAM